MNTEQLAEARLFAQEAVRKVRANKQCLDQASLDLILTDARSHYAWQDKPVSDDIIRTLFDITIAGPTSMNTCPARFIFVQSDEAKQRLAKSLKAKNIDKMMDAPATVIIAWDPEFWKQLPFLFPHENRMPMFDGNEAYAYDTAYRNSTLQGGYFMIAARALGLDVGAMSGFSNQIVDEEFFSENGWKSNFLCNFGYADETALFQKLPRFSFEQACRFI
ncbi:malonic semialdehyde reductase [Leucothrix arctica]|uniref:Malonic semialdehyde reductase n=2 Tax=Leucothrix arctica TaxID=1481894 RepID=A0A317C8A1_9GAMM|nr:malonic semialdehyde reductase [Leucothrix arctica]